ncbi:MAG TPA: MBL fold metallo-hydrolase [Terriglobia bacterium]|nr:MBL fold metallo-hydrolase [Terriglobia bacterium]
MREIYPGAYQIHSLFGGRNLFQYLLVGDNTVLVDTGLAYTPERTIFPALKQLGFNPGQIKLAITTHADGDHQGGNDAIKRESPRTWLSCGKADRALVEDPRTLWNQRYNFLKQDYGVGIDPDPSPDAGRPRRMDVCFTGGEPIRIRADWDMEVLHVPGHSHGHLALLDRKQKAAFAGDAIHGRGCPNADGTMALPVTYYYVDAYLSTLTLFENLPIDTLYTGHWPTMRGAEILDFIAVSRQTVQIFDEVILKTLASRPAGVGMQELINEIGRAFGDWPQNMWVFIMFPLKGHLDRLVEQGKVREIRTTRPFKWALS